MPNAEDVRARRDMRLRQDVQARRFAVAALAAWRVTHLLSSEDGPGAALASMRAHLGSGWVGELADCFQCLSLWVAMPLTPFVARRRGEAAVTWLALSGAACLLEQLSAQRAPEPIELEAIPEEEHQSLWDAAERSGQPL
jgi:hypothetical protein